MAAREGMVRFQDFFQLKKHVQQQGERQVLGKVRVETLFDDPLKIDAASERRHPAQ